MLIFKINTTNQIAELSQRNKNIKHFVTFDELLNPENASVAYRKLNIHTFKWKHVHQIC